MHVFIVAGPVAVEHGCHQTDGKAAGKQATENDCDGSMETRVIEQAGVPEQDVCDDKQGHAR